MTDSELLSYANRVKNMSRDWTIVLLHDIVYHQSADRHREISSLVVFRHKNINHEKMSLSNILLLVLLIRRMNYVPL